MPDGRGTSSVAAGYNAEEAATGRSTVGVAVYPRLGELLRASNLTVDELERQIEEQYGLSVDPEALHQLADGDPVQRADLEVAGASALGSATAALRFNDSRLDGPLGPRHEAILQGRYPPGWVRAFSER